VDAVDIAENALKELKKHEMTCIQAIHDAMPDSTLQDHSYDIVLCMEIIAELTKDDYRLFFSELARLVKYDGLVICSTSIDFKTEGGIERLFELAQTEFDILDAKPSYHALSIRIKSFFEAPANFIAGSLDESKRKKEIERRTGFKRYWYSLNSKSPLRWIWQLVNPLTKPFLQWLKNSQWLLLKLESICEFVHHDNGISHIIFIAKLRPLIKIDPNEIPIETRHKKEVWE
jgi:ubiquinone/menaquinone biosynthesis C-methylase UbiE